MDLEGTDSGERGEDRTTFERQTILYGLALCEVLIVNMWEHDIGYAHIRFPRLSRMARSGASWAIARIFFPFLIFLRVSIPSILDGTRPPTMAS
jgi:hypothetical protein